MKKAFFLCFFLTVFLIKPLVAQQGDCYISVESAGSYDKLTVETISLTMLRQFVDAGIQPTPLGGFSEKDCMYRVNVTEQQEGIKVFILGKNISDYGTSNLRGEPGLEQGVLRAIYKGLDKQTSSICQKYGTVLDKECLSGGSRQTQPVNQQGWQQPSQGQQFGRQPPPRPPRPECQPKQGEKLPEFCNQQPQQGQFGPPRQGQGPPRQGGQYGPPGQGQGQQYGQQPPRQGQRQGPPRQGGQYGQQPPRQGQQPPPECRPQRGKKLPDYCRRPPQNQRQGNPPPRRRN